MCASGRSWTQPGWRVLEGCALWPDVDSVPAGVHTSFGEQKQNLRPAQGPWRLLCRQEARFRPERSIKSILEKDHTTSLTQTAVPLDDHDRTAWPTGKDSMQYGRDLTL
ncbi:multidrug resistance-associated protein 6-like isoform X2 [Sapajus apella]|uniref:Multidrug resistance-associated protein 6-like isoform X2 n=1 Tax=Sapajus apella TaxID=9515 RepID=A0A6J3GDS5_SAPAP|nr:multidrug resistance-associated protein 6-like isoform X2 [Sapajus apella]